MNYLLVFLGGGIGASLRHAVNQLCARLFGTGFPFGTFVINIGELLEMASSGYLKATMHRVVSPPAGTERLSVAFFLGAKLDATVPVLELPQHLAAEARGVTQDPMNPLFMDVGRNYLKSRIRSHPDVARAHYADLLSAEELQRVGPGSAY